MPSPEIVEVAAATGVDPDAVIRTAGWLAGKLGKPVQSGVAKAGPFPAPASVAASLSGTS